MKNFSLERQAENIASPLSAEYFREVYSSFSNGNNRAALVGLWSCVVCDLLLKMQELRDLYGDQAAGDILLEIENKRLTNPKSPEWEELLLTRVTARTQLLDPIHAVTFRELRELRHICAHPVLIANTYEMSTPDSDIVLAMMRAVLDGLLTKPALLSKKVFDTLVEDLEQKREFLVDRVELGKYLGAKYLRRAPDSVKRALFKSLWRVCFRSEDPRAVANRPINMKALEVLAENLGKQATSDVRSEQAYFSEISSIPQTMAALLIFLARNPEFYSLLDTSASTVIQAQSRNDQGFRTVTWFLAPSFEHHLEGLKDDLRKRALTITKSTYDALRRIAERQGAVHSVNQVSILAYATSVNYEAADTAFSGLCRPNLSTWSREDFDLFLTECPANDQTWGRYAAHGDHSHVKEQFQAMFPGEWKNPTHDQFAATFD